MPIHEKSLIRPENLKTHDELVLDGVDVSGHWSTFIESRVVKDYNEDLEDEIAALPGGEKIHRCWQCGSCTNACTVNAINPDFNPRYWIYLIRMGMESELLRDKDIIWQCVSCNKCTYACPRDVFPGRRHESDRALARAERPHAEVAVDAFRRGLHRADRRNRQDRGKPLDPPLLRAHRSRSWCNLDDRDGEAPAAGLPVKLLTRMGLATLVAPKTSDWGQGVARRSRSTSTNSTKSTRRR